MPKLELWLTPWVISNAGEDFFYYVAWDFTSTRWFDVTPVPDYSFDAAPPGGHSPDPVPTTLEVVRRWTVTDTKVNARSTIWQQCRNLSPPGTMTSFRMSAVRTTIGAE